jgi:hypothetical protein
LRIAATKDTTRAQARRFGQAHSGSYTCGARLVRARHNQIALVRQSAHNHRLAAQLGVQRLLDGR